MNFDINNRSAWRPFFTSATTSIKLESVQVSEERFNKSSESLVEKKISSNFQPNELEYERTNRDEVNTLQTQIYEILRDKIQDWRLPEATRWNFGFQRRLNEFLKELVAKEKIRDQSICFQHKNKRMDFSRLDVRKCYFPTNKIQRPMLYR